MVPLHSGNHVAHASTRLSRGLGNQLPHDHRPLFDTHHLRTLGGLHPDNSVVADPTLALHPQGTSALLDFDSYISFVVILTLVIGASFLFPMIIIGIHTLGLASTSQILRRWRWAVVGATVFAAITNPLPDLWSMILQMCALLALYFGALGVCWLRDLLARRRKRKREAAPSPDPIGS